MASSINADNGVVSGSSGLKSTADTSGVLALQSNGSTGVTLDTSLNVGVGTTSPVEKLTVSGSVSSSSEFVIKSGTTAKFALGQTSDAFYIYSNAAGADRLVINSSGNLGIGTSSPVAKLSVSNSGAAGIEFSPTAGNLGGAYIQGYNRSTSAYTAVEVISSQFGVYPNGTERFRIGSAGQIGLSGANYGTSGQVLTSGGSGAAPTWTTPGGGSWVYLSTVTASGAATADVETTFDSTYDMYAIVGVGIYPATDGVQLYCRLKVGGTYRTSNYACITYGVTVSTGSVLFNRSSAATAIQVNTDASGGYGTLNNEASTPGFLIMYVQKPSDSSIYQSVFGSYAYTPEDAGTNFTQGQFSGSYKSAVGALTGVRFLASSGNINGTFRLYGIKNS